MGLGCRLNTGGEMQNPSEAITQYSQAGSVGNMWASLNARRHAKGLPMVLPVGRTAIVRMAAEADYVGDKKLTIRNKMWFLHDNVLWFTFLLPAGWVWLMNRVPK